MGAAAGDGDSSVAPNGDSSVAPHGSGATLVVSEVFGPTLQGEGPSAGRSAGFVRLGRCNLACTWCDTSYTWDWDRHDPARELTTMGVDAVLAQLDAMEVDRLVVTGGEPLLQQRHLPPLLEGAKERGWTIELETAGTVAPAAAVELVDRFNVSPKLANSGMAVERRYRPDVLRSFQATGRAVYKFVASGPADLVEVEAMVAECGLGPVWVMPEGTDAGTVVARMRELAPHVLARRWNLTPRLHVLLWGDQRGT
ncbi:MAG TPA: 7-carboxy-7-deazaguanine synthase QueE [Acidimicrobiales bacterium]|nr:7-carboxy-7-deazaguanine synthase QueE [Acidimicrobiales bacterium]